MNFSGKYGSSPRISALSAPPSPASPQPKAKVKANTCGTLMPSPLAARGSSTAGRAEGGARAAAEPRARQHELQGGGQQPADDDDHQPVAADADAEHVE